MTNLDVKRLALVLAEQAEIEGMKAENQRCEILQQSPSYHEGFFSVKADILRKIARADEVELLNMMNHGAV